MLEESMGSERSLARAAVQINKILEKYRLDGTSADCPAGAGHLDRTSTRICSNESMSSCELRWYLARVSSAAPTRMVSSLSG